jgi:hypothetical protein
LVNIGLPTDSIACAAAAAAAAGCWVLQNGTDDKTFHALFQPIMSKVMEVFRPGAIVIQCGEHCTTVITLCWPTRKLIFHMQITPVV